MHFRSGLAEFWDPARKVGRVDERTGDVWDAVWLLEGRRGALLTRAAVMQARGGRLVLHAKPGQSGPVNLPEILGALSVQPGAGVPRTRRMLHWPPREKN